MTPLFADALRAFVADRGFTGPSACDMERFEEPWRCRRGFFRAAGQSEFARESTDFCASIPLQRPD
jgi:hypothetical protein